MEASVATIASDVRETGVARAASVQWPVYAVLFASTSIIVGLQWDISWHLSIGRDTFWTPAHLAIYVGGLVAGLTCGWLALAATFGRAGDTAAATVRFWGFRAPLGAWVCIWGSFAMLTSAPFDDWWHNAYGLDVKILSPPHVLLAAGMAAIQLGAMLMLLALQNRAADARARAFSLMHAYAAGVLVLMFAVMSSEYADKILRHRAIFYIVACGVFPFLLVSTARGSKLRWPATTIAGVYMALTLVMVWVLPLFPAEPKLGPIHQHITRMVAPDFPLLLIVPAFVIDLLMRQRDRLRRDTVLAIVVGMGFLAALIVVEWPFASFLLSPASHNWFFAGDNYPYMLPRESFTYRGAFLPPVDGFATGMGIAALLGILSARLGLWWGNWMSRVQR